MPLPNVEPLARIVVCEDDEATLELLCDHLPTAVGRSGMTTVGRGALLEALDRHGVEYVVIGSIAAQTRGWGGQTLDLDICPARSSENRERLAGFLNEDRGEVVSRRLRGSWDRDPRRL